ncbi:Rho guanyl nucleotide exchange factor [Aspergillus japonicus CBS 114.51]|uniref:Rho guanyl nucleotide exchange factor n=2 Tax=Aspergillus TaxID=5052 RepID=A0A2V5HDM4_ASPV1|nr:Rho guanyl nucleotide exchange factor [Aspergillus japonicus CBS 114.51]PYI22445.1 Rho guanyl nucleotide exchange factor [Aspergillus violaceofuscus CBS 115571]RAH85773.1 Rho guanyl nucleotide exchange factor [Aspergillus japonicus CBS 114.51]
MAETVISNGGPIAEDNIINRRGGESIYQSCVNLKKRLAEVPNFEPHLQEMEEADLVQGNTDPVASLWNCLRNGYPLLAIYNASGPDENLEIDPAKVPEAKRPKAATFKFLQASLQELAFPQQDCFLITDLYGENTTGFLKVIKMVNRVLDILEMQGQLKRPSDEAARAPVKGAVKLTKREHILKELLETERDYVHHLQNLQALKKELEETGALTGDHSHQIFLNLNNLLDFAQRFLIRIEQHYALPEERQNWGELFTQHEEAFKQYEPFIANQLRCDEVCLREWDKIRVAPRSLDLQQMVAQPATLNGFFVKPFQRLTKYPLMLKELGKQMENPDLQNDIQRAIDAIQSVLDSANDAIDKEHLQTAVKDLDDRVDDWKALKIEAFGDLLRFGTFSVIKGDNGKDSEREYHIYLFERILLCCKDINPNKQKTKLMVGKDKPATTGKGKPRLQLKGRIYMANVTDVLCMPKPGSYRIQIFWKGDPGVVDNFIIRYQNEDVMRKWSRDIEAQRAIQAEQRSARNTSTSETEFTYMKSMANMPNPYQQEYDEEQAATKEAAFFSEFPMSRNASSTSLRTRSATGGSGSSGPVGRPPRFPVPDPSLSVHTQFPGGSMSPAERNANSYFSPVAETPSTRSSSQSTGYFSSRQATPTNNWSEDHPRYTAPALSRATSRDGPNSNPYFNGASNGRSAQRPSLPPMSGGSAQAANGMAQRMRSASSPDIHNAELRRYMQSMESVPVPPIPAHMASMKAPVNRSQNNSPTSNTQLPIRNANHLSNSQHVSPTHFNEPQYGDHRPNTAATDQPTSPLSYEPDEEPLMPTQLKVKVNFDDNYVTLVIASNIMFRSLIDRVDAKLARFTTKSITSKSVRLRYRDEDGDFVTIDSDEAVQLAFLEWREQQRDMLARGQVGEIQLYCQAVET